MSEVELIPQVKNILRAFAFQSPLYDREQRAMVLPEATLLLAVIGQALAEVSWAGSRRPERRHCAKEALRWFNSEALAPFAEALGLNATWIRRKVNEFWALIEPREEAVAA